MARERGGFCVGLALVAPLAALVLSACSPPEDTVWTRVNETGVLRVGMDASFPPFEAVAPDGSLVGFDVALVRELGRRLELEPQFVANLPYDGLYDALTAGRVDIVVSALVVNPALTADYAYSTPYFDAGPVLVVPQEEQGIHAMADLAGHRLAVALGTQSDQEARRWARRLERLMVVQHETAADALRAVEQGQADAALVDHVSALQGIAAGAPLAITGKPVVSVAYAAAVRHDSRQLLHAINETLETMEHEGMMERLVAEFLSAP